MSFRYSFSPDPFDTTSICLSSLGVLASCSLLICFEIPPELILPDGRSMLEAAIRFEISPRVKSNSRKLSDGTSIQISWSRAPSNLTFAKPMLIKSSRICLAKYFSVFSENGPDISILQTSSRCTTCATIGFSISWGNVVILETADCTSVKAFDMDVSASKKSCILVLPS